MIRNPAWFSVSSINTKFVMGNTVSRAVFGANPSSNQPLQLSITSGMGRYMLYVTLTGIALYDLEQGKTIWSK